MCKQNNLISNTKRRLYKKQDISSFSDTDLINAYKADKNKNLVGELYTRYTRMVFLVSMKYLKNEEKADDAVMQIFEKLFTDLLKHEVKNFKGWLHTVTRNHCLIKLRSEKSILKKQQDYKKDTETFMELAPDFHQTGKEEKKLTTLEEAITKLKPKQKQCIQLFYLKEKSYTEVADTTGFTMKEVKSYIQNGKRNLKIILERAGISGAILLFLQLY